MDPTSLIVGRTYYIVTFADVEQTMPGINPLVYIGIDVFGAQPDGGAPKYYFQDTRSFSMFGMATEENPPVRFEGEEQDEPAEYFVTSHEAREIGWTIVDLPGAEEEVKKAAERAAQLGFPILKRTHGKWHRTRSSREAFGDSLNAACSEISEAARLSAAVFQDEEVSLVRRELAQLLEQIESRLLVRLTR